jgi:hypothetical protein
LRRDGYRFRVPEGTEASWDRVLFLNLTFWDPSEQGDVLPAASIPADVVTHVAWHHLSRRAFPKPSADALFFGEAIASAFDLYLVGRLLGHAPESQFLETQVPAMAEVASSAGLSEDEFETLLQSIAADPERAFEDLRELLFDAGSALTSARGVNEAAAVLARYDAHRFGPLLHHYEMSNWVLYARAYASDALSPDAGVRALDAALRTSDNALDRLEREWLAPGSKEA